MTHFVRAKERDMAAQVWENILYDLNCLHKETGNEIVKEAHMVLQDAAEIMFREFKKKGNELTYKQIEYNVLDSDVWPNPRNIAWMLDAVAEHWDRTAKDEESKGATDELRNYAKMLRKLKLTRHPERGC